TRTKHGGCYRPGFRRHQREHMRSSRTCPRGGPSMSALWTAMQHRQAASRRVLRRARTALRLALHAVAPWRWRLLWHRLTWYRPWWYTDRFGVTLRLYAELPGANAWTLMTHAHFDDAAALEHVSALVGPGMTVFDVGAHHGAFALWAMHQVGPSGHVHAFEPTPSTFARLVAHLPPTMDARQTS